MRPYRAGTSTFKTHCTAAARRSGASGPMLSPGKYADHLPLYRQSEIYRRQGAGAEPRHTGALQSAVAELLEPLYDAADKWC
ncbi:IS66 family transposase [Escherichia coli]